MTARVSVASSCARVRQAALLSPARGGAGRARRAGRRAAVASGGAGPAAPSPGEASTLRSLLSMEREELSALVSQLDQQQYRIKQIETGMYKWKARSVTDIRGLPGAFKDDLRRHGVDVGRSAELERSVSGCGTTKLLLRQADGRVIETVGIPVFGRDAGAGAEGRRPKRLTVCVSSQVGCAMRCSFCATGKMGFSRNLLAGEIVDQVLHMEEAFQSRASHVVFMGMGEPLMNMKNVVRAVRDLNEKVGIGERHMTISTVGVPNQLRRLAELGLQVTLAVSLHAPTQRLREELIPAAKSYPLDALMGDCVAYFEATGRRVSFEYTLIGSVNDREEDARALSKLLGSYGLHGHVNLIPYNPISDCDYERPSRNRVFRFMQTLHDGGTAASVRETRGLEADAACGQLRASFKGSRNDPERSG